MKLDECICNDEVIFDIYNWPRIATMWGIWTSWKTTYAVRPLPMDFSDKTYPKYFDSFEKASQEFESIVQTKK